MSQQWKRSTLLLSLTPERDKENGERQSERERIWKGNGGRMNGIHTEAVGLICMNYAHAPWLSTMFHSININCRHTQKAMCQKYQFVFEQWMKKRRRRKEENTERKEEQMIVDTINEELNPTKCHSTRCWTENRAISTKVAFIFCCYISCAVCSILCVFIFFSLAENAANEMLLKKLRDKPVSYDINGIKWESRTWICI